MSLRKQNNSLLDSNRERKKLQQAIRLLQQQDKPKKKRKINELSSQMMRNRNEEKDNKQQQTQNLIETKQPSQFSLTPNHELLSTQKKYLSSQKYVCKIEKNEIVFNSLNQYQFKQLQKSFEKQYGNYDIINMKGQQIKLEQIQNKILINKLNQILKYFKEIKNNNELLFSNLHKQISNNISNLSK